LKPVPEATPPELSSALRAYVSNAAYRSRLLAGVRRIDLDGNVAGTVTAEQEVKPRQAAKAVEAAAGQVQEAAQPERDGLAELRAAAQHRKAEVAAIDAS
jgi:sRNA-binding protein